MIKAVTSFALILSLFQDSTVGSLPSIHAVIFFAPEILNVILSVVTDLSLSIITIVDESPLFVPQSIELNDADGFTVSTVKVMLLATAALPTSSVKLTARVFDVLLSRPFKSPAVMSIIAVFV